MTDKKRVKTASAKPDYVPTSKERALLAKSQSRDDAATVVKSIRPRHQVEAMLTAASTVTLGRRLVNADSIPQQDRAERALNKLARTFAAQIEAL
jgi:hypothetical protein